MPRLFILALAISFIPAQPLFAQHAKLSAKDLDAGWLLLFDGATTFGWTPASDATKATVQDGALTFEAGAQDQQLDCTTAFGSFELMLEYQLTGNPNSERKAGIVIRRGITSSSPAFLRLQQAGKWTPYRQTVKLTKNGKNLEVTTDYPGVRDGVGLSELIKIGARSDANRITLLAPLGVGLSVRNVKLRPLGFESLFNGKDLTGWKIFPGKKSKFAVADGAISIKDGPGDLQTTRKFADFVLQLECYSHGKHLNSGIFFRCRDNEYQNGYEAQVRNEFSEPPGKTYLVDAYDPKTHTLLGKVKVQSTAIDFGTGGIYRRQPARLGNSKDGEWFRMTVVAQGNHFATWVNGIQVTDWTDNRPASDNARKGCRLEEGHISLQGHDPTTHLSFRNFRIAPID